MAETQRPMGRWVSTIGMHGYRGFDFILDRWWDDDATLEEGGELRH